MARRRRRERNYQVDKIIDKRFNTDNRQTEFLIKWKSSMYKDEWIPEVDLCCSELLEEYERNQTIPSSPAFSEEDVDIFDNSTNTTTASINNVFQPTNSSSSFVSNTTSSSDHVRASSIVDESPVKRPRRNNRSATNGKLNSINGSSQFNSGGGLAGGGDQITTNNISIIESIFSNEKNCLNHYKIRDVNELVPDRIITETEARESYSNELKLYLTQQQERITNILSQI